MKNEEETLTGTYKQLNTELAPVFDYLILAENLVTFGKIKNELENKLKLKRLTPNEKSLLILNQSLCDYLIEFHKAVIAQKLNKEEQSNEI